MRRKLLLITCLCLLTFLSFFTPQAAHASTPITSSSIMSQGLPAFTNDDFTGAFPATNANDSIYTTYWRSQAVPAWLSYDISGLSSAQKASVMLVWYNNCCAYDHTLVSGTAFNIPGNYTIEAN